MSSLDDKPTVILFVSVVSAKENFSFSFDQIPQFGTLAMDAKIIPELKIFHSPIVFRKIHIIRKDPPNPIQVTEHRKIIFQKESRLNGKQNFRFVSSV